MAKILYGCDPECVTTYNVGDKIFALPPWYFRRELSVPASADKRHPVFLERNGWKLHEDGAAFEMSVTPSHDPYELFQTVQDCRNTAEKEILSHFTEVCDGKLNFLPAVGWDVERWMQMRRERGESFWDDFRMSTQFGCDPDEDIFNLETACTVLDAAEHPWRYCGGHMHFSGSKKIADDYQLAIRCLVVTAGVAAVVFSDVPQLERERTFLYGRPGKFRVQKYGEDNPFGKDYAVGIEYRTPSARTWGDWEIAKNVIHWAEIGISVLLENPHSDDILREITQPAITAILTANQELGQQILSHVNSKL